MSSLLYIGCSEPQVYDKLRPYVLDESKRAALNIPRRDAERPEFCKIPIKIRSQVRNELGTSLSCSRCSKIYPVDGSGMPQEDLGDCSYHRYRAFPGQITDVMHYTCCDGSVKSPGCCRNKYHVQDGEDLLEYYSGFVETQPKPEKDPNQHGIYALRCRVALTTHGPELAKVSVVDYKGNSRYEEFVKPKHTILDYNTKYTGVSESDLANVSKTLSDVQKDLLEIFSTKTILVGHDIHKDMFALKLFHKMLIDTVILFPHAKGLPAKQSLSTLMVQIGESIRQDSKLEARSALVLAYWEINIWYTATQVQHKPRSKADLNANFLSYVKRHYT